MAASEVFVRDSSSPPRRPFLTAEWRTLAMLNYEVDPALVQPLAPRGTEIDFWEGRTYVSMVGFLFLGTRLLGVPPPLHRNFEEVNLRFYLRREAAGEVRRGVAFVKEIVPRWAIAQVARLAYNENYVSLPMRHRREGFGAGEPGSRRVEIRLATSRTVAAPGGRGGRRAAAPRRRLARGVYRGALLGILPATRRRHDRVFRGASPLACLEGERGSARLRCRKAIRSRLR